MRLKGILLVKTRDKIRDKENRKSVMLDARERP